MLFLFVHHYVCACVYVLYLFYLCMCGSEFGPLVGGGSPIAPVRFGWPGALGRSSYGRIKWGFSPPRLIAPSQHKLARGGAPSGPHVSNHSANDAADLGER